MRGGNEREGEEGIRAKKGAPDVEARRKTVSPFFQS